MSTFFYVQKMPKTLEKIAEKVYDGIRITKEEGLYLYQKADIGFLAVLANHIRSKRFGKQVYFNKNFHIEPTNICIYNCKFCSYKRKKGEQGAWDYTIDQMLDAVSKYKHTDVTEVHIVGGVHPDHDLHFYGRLISEIKKIMPRIYIKGFTAIELDFMIRKAHLPLEEGLKTLKAYGLDAIPGGGAEIFDETIRKQICDEKTTAKLWLKIHETAHRIGISSNATILYGHIESYENRISHMAQLRELQDKTNGFNAYIPLKFKKENNHLSYIGEVSLIEDLKNFAVSRIFLDNIPHLKAYWPMLGKQLTQTTLSFGVDDIDGTIDDSTKIYSMAGADDQHPTMSTQEIIKLIKSVNLIPVERDTIY
ncbi:MAG TPA: aminofutalosine synthase MqnE, partial [Bacteroidales bacterium]|nr:aminofutalosine synthase MqnE [Bacteroidales bacterium]